MTTMLKSICSLFLFFCFLQSGFSQTIISLNGNAILSCPELDTSFTTSIPFTIPIAYSRAHHSSSTFPRIDKLPEEIYGAEWQLTMDFRIPASPRYSKQYLVINRLATYATIYLNGHKIASTENAFRTYRFFADPYLQTGRNILKIIFHPTSPEFLPSPQLPSPLAIDYNHLHRQSQLYRALDMHKLRSYRGLIGSISLHRWNKVRIIDRELNPHYDSRTAVIRDELTIDAIKSGESIVWERAIYRKNLPRPLKLLRDTFYLRDQELRSTITFDKINPWKVGSADNTFYGYRSTLIQGENILWSDSIPLAFRKVDIHVDKQSHEVNFYVNNHTQFIKGVSIFPWKYFPDKISDADMEYYFKALSKAHVNLVRIPASTHYVSDAFYDYCDSLGILVWHDFMFYEAIYPFSHEYLRNVEEEITEVVKRAARHPSIFLWLGNDAVYQKLVESKLKTAQNKHIFIRYEQNYKRLFYDKIPLIIQGFDPGINYIRSTDNRNKRSHRSATEFHNLPDDYDYRNKNIPSGFISSQGIYGLPITTFAQANVSDSINSIRKKQILDAIEKKWGYRDNRTEISKEERYLSQVLQYIGVNNIIQDHICNWPQSHGLIIHGLNASVPGISSSLLDYAGNAKGGYYAMKQNYSPSGVFLQKNGDKLIPVLKTQLREPIDYHFTLEKWDIKRNKLLRKDTALIMRDRDSIYHLPALFSDIEQEEGVLWRLKCSYDGYHLHNVVRMEDWKKIDKSEPVIKIGTYHKETGIYRIILTSDKLSFFTQLSATVPGFFSENYFTLFPGEKKVIYFEPTQPSDGVNFSTLTLNEVLHNR